MLSMLPPILLLALVIPPALTQTTSACPAIATTGTAPNTSTAYADRDPHFVYSRSNCTSTAQKVITIFWTTPCTVAIDSLCGSTSGNSAHTGSWSWSWYSELGSTCQVGLWQPEDLSSPNAPVGITEECCRASFTALVNRVHGELYEAVGVADLSNFAGLPNRGSINIAPGGYPFAKTTYSDGQQALTDGMQVGEGVPSFIVQGVPPPYPYSAIEANCTQKDVSNNPGSRSPVALTPGT